MTRTSVAVCGPSRLRGEERYVRAATFRVWGGVVGGGGGGGVRGLGVGGGRGGVVGEGLRV